MKKFYFILLTVIAFSANGQRQYLDAQYDVSVETNIVYANNISVITGAPAAEDLLMDVYTPDNSETNRPLILLAHTGSFLPPIINGQATGAKTDGTVVHMANELAARGYVVAAFTYRQGWNPVSTDQNVRTGTLLQAAYRGIQDTRSCVRYFRKSADVDGNPYGIDPAKIGVGGIGTGGYLAFGTGTVYDFEEVTLDKFYDTTTGLPYVDSLVLGNLYGDTQAAICLPNHPGYDSGIDFAFNVGGACGDGSWVDGEEREAALCGVHATNDIFAPYAEGPVIVPTTNEFVVNVAGTRAAIEYANNNGNNDVFNDLDAENDPLRDLIDAQKETDVTLYTMQTLKLGTDNFYGFVTPFPQGSPWDWWDKNVLDAQVAGINAALGTDYDADAIHASGLQTNPDMSPEKGMIYVDTIMQLVLPRACYALNLGCNFSNTENVISSSDIGLSIAPNPAVNNAVLSSSVEFPIESIYLYDMQGKLVKAVNNVNSSNYLLARNNLNSGVYIVNIATEKGLVIEKIVFE